MPRFEKLLIANRGEIAVRVARTARGLGFATVAVYSDADRGAPHVAACDEAVAIGGASAKESYLSIEAIVDAALRSGADAVHPGYGFLSENAAFAEACAAAGLTFVGPPPAAIRTMGNKAAAKTLVLAAGVACIPGYQGPQDDAAFDRAAREIGFPVMLKAAAGGGGRGMRLVHAPQELAAALDSARVEARRAFGSDELLLEKALDAPRHIEVQVFGDAFGTIVHLGERDCSIQRRHQKIVEEAPSPAVSPELRERMGAAAIEVARAVGYTGAGTVEFLLDGGGAFYFMEMNTRLQVEHAVTEAITGIDLVAWQLRVASGEPLPRADPRGARAAHAIEARLYAEDPAHGFLPQAGRIVAWHAPAGDGVRIDHALAPGLDVSAYYDPLLAKVVASGADREEARRRLTAALEELQVAGLTTNRRFLIDCLGHEAFIGGDARTDFVQRYFAETGVAAPDPGLLALAAVLLYRGDEASTAGAAWRSSGIATAVVRLRCGEATSTAAIATSVRDEYAVTVAGQRFTFSILGQAGPVARYAVNGVEHAARIARHGNALYVQAGRDELGVVDVTYAPAVAGGRSAQGAATSPMPGIVSKVAVAAGDTVAKGQTLVVLEAMKMLHEIVATMPGRVAAVHVAAGQQVGMRALLVEIEPQEANA